MKRLGTGTATVTRTLSFPVDWAPVAEDAVLARFSAAAVGARVEAASTAYRLAGEVSFTGRCLSCFADEVARVRSSLLTNVTVTRGDGGSSVFFSAAVVPPASRAAATRAMKKHADFVARAQLGTASLWPSPDLIADVTVTAACDVCGGSAALEATLDRAWASVAPSIAGAGAEGARCAAAGGCGSLVVRLFWLALVVCLAVAVAAVALRAIRGDCALPLGAAAPPSPSSMNGVPGANAGAGAAADGASFGADPAAVTLALPKKKKSERMASSTGVVEATASQQPLFVRNRRNYVDV